VTIPIRNVGRLATGSRMNGLEIGPSDAAGEPNVPLCDPVEIPSTHEQR